MSYLPFGGVRTTVGTPPTAGFPGQWFQSETGLHQNWMRDYDPTTARFLQADPLGLVDGASVYNYAGQNPGQYVDPTGQCIGPLVELGIVMIKRTARIKIGDVFQVRLENERSGYFQYIADDATMLQSYVIRIFQYISSDAEAPPMEDIETSGTNFYAHVLIKVGLKLGYWQKIGTAALPDKVDVMFRGSDDYGNPEVKVSHRWQVWRINEPMQYIGELTPPYQKAEIGIVLAPPDIADRINNGKYSMVYPGY